MHETWNLREVGVRDFLWFQLCKGLLFIYLFITENVNSPRVFCSCRRADLARTESQTLAAPILPPLPLGCRCNWWPTGDRWADVRVHVFIRQSTIWLEKARPDLPCLAWTLDQYNKLATPNSVQHLLHPPKFHTARQLPESMVQHLLLKIPWMKQTWPKRKSVTNKIIDIYRKDKSSQ